MANGLGSRRPGGERRHDRVDALVGRHYGELVVERAVPESR